MQHYKWNWHTSEQDSMLTFSITFLIVTSMPSLCSSCQTRNSNPPPRFIHSTPGLNVSTETAKPIATVRPLSRLQLTFELIALVSVRAQNATQNNFVKAAITWEFIGTKRVIYGPMNIVRFVMSWIHVYCCHIWQLISLFDETERQTCS